MAKVKLSSLLSQISGTVGNKSAGAQTFTTYNSKLTTVKAYTKPKDYKTLRQQAWRTAFANAASRWNGLGADTRNKFNEAATKWKGVIRLKGGVRDIAKTSKPPQSGYALYIKSCLFAQAAGLPPPTDPPIPNFYFPIPSPLTYSIDSGPPITVTIYWPHPLRYPTAKVVLWIYDKSGYFFKQTNPAGASTYDRGYQFFDQLMTAKTRVLENLRSPSTLYVQAYAVDTDGNLSNPSDTIQVDIP